MPAEQLDTVDALAQLTFTVQGLLDRRAGEHGVSVVLTRLLGVLRDRTPGMNELATLLGLDKSSVTGLVDRAERRGLVRRAPSSADRRAVLVELTAEGGRLVDQVATTFAADVSALLAGLDRGEQDSLTEILSRVLVAHAAARGIDLFEPRSGQLRARTAASASTPPGRL